MLSVDTSDTSKDLTKYIDDLTKRLTNMVSGFAYELTLIAAENTPMGSDGSLETGRNSLSGPERSYFEAYEKRNQLLGTNIEVGYHRGSWQYSETGAFSRSNLYGTNSGDLAARNALFAVRSNYKLGETFYIGSEGLPMDDGSSTIVLMDQGQLTSQASGGIVQPTLNQVLSTYRINLKSWFDGVNRG